MERRWAGSRRFCPCQLTDVTVQAPNWARVEAILSVFEEERAEATIVPASATEGVERSGVADFPIFSLSTPLPSCLVDRCLVEAIEKYMRDDVPRIASLEEHQDSAFATAVTDLLGTEQFSTLQTHALSKFPDATREIEIESSISRRNGERLGISVQFNSDRDLSRVSIRSRLPQAREIGMIHPDEPLDPQRQAA
jgi:hypothetical protein